jgi:outer membrane immunogenic protein
MHNKLISSLAGAAFSFAVSGLAFAADMAVKMPVKAPPPPAPVYSWTGWYVGGNVGAIWSEAATSVSNLAAFAPAAGGSYLFPVNYPTIAAVGTNNLTNTGFLGGIQAGYNWQISSLVLGAEADFSGTTASGTVNASAPYPVTPSPASFFWATSV